VAQATPELGVSSPWSEDNWYMSPVIGWVALAVLGTGLEFIATWVRRIW
jgi:hypothetical protein